MVVGTAVHVPPQASQVLAAQPRHAHWPVPSARVQATRCRAAHTALGKASPARQSQVPPQLCRGGSAAVVALGLVAQRARRGRSSVLQVVVAQAVGSDSQARTGCSCDARGAAEAAAAACGPKRIGVLLLNIGTPASTSVDDVRDYLSRFLADERVLDIQPSFLKTLVLQAILATRPASSARNYAKIWDPKRGSPLLFHSKDLAERLQLFLGDSYEVRLGFQYSEPSVEGALNELRASGVDDIVLVPMYPQYASSTTGSCLAGAYRAAAGAYCTPYLSVIPPFFSDEAYLSVMATKMIESIGTHGEKVDHILFSFHGVPEKHCTSTDDTGSVCSPSSSTGCQNKAGCCHQLVRANRNCYRAQCFEAARLLARRLNLEDGQWSLGFQSRLTLRGSVKWIEPYTDEVLERLAHKGVQRLAVVAPSFTVDCVETLEELGITGREEFVAAGGKELVVIPCLNSSPEWAKALAHIVRATRPDPNGQQEAFKQEDAVSYEGPIVNGEREGEGRVTFPNGVIIEGMFVGGKLEGRGAIVHPSGRRTAVMWEGGIPTAEGGPQLCETGAGIIAAEEARRVQASKCPAT